MVRRFFCSIIAILFSLVAIAQIKGQDYTVDKSGNVVVAKIVEGLALQRDDIYLAALKYLENAYKDTKYKIVINSKDNSLFCVE